MSTPFIFIPSSEQEALEWLLPALDAPVHDMPPEDFNRAWHAIQYLYMGLNPDDAAEHGDEVDHTTDNGPDRFLQIEPRLVAPYYVQSGWPVVLAPLVAEARARYEKDTMTEEEFYNLDALHAGHRDRSEAAPESGTTPSKS